MKESVYYGIHLLAMTCAEFGGRIEAIKLSSAAFDHLVRELRDFSGESPGKCIHVMEMLLQTEAGQVQVLRGSDDDPP